MLARTCKQLGYVSSLSTAQNEWVTCIHLYHIGYILITLDRVFQLSTPKLSELCLIHVV